MARSGFATPPVGAEPVDVFDSPHRPRPRQVAESELDDLMRDLEIAQEDEAAHDIAPQIASQAPNLPADNNRLWMRDLSDHALLALRSHDATKELCRAISRVCWIDDLQDRLCKLASMIHKELRACFHVLPIDYDTARRIREVARAISEIQVSWLEHIIPLQRAVRAMDVVRDTPNLSDIPKEEHGEEIKRFKRMLVPIPTQVGAECNRQIIDLMYQLFREEVQLPFGMSVVGHSPLTPPEITVKSYLAALESKFREIHVASIELLMTTATTWDHWKKMGEKIARDANSGQSSWNSHDFKTRTKDAFSRVLSLTRKGSGSVPRTSSGQLQISLPLGRISQNAARDTMVHGTSLEAPSHPLDARSSSSGRGSSRQPSSQTSSSTEWGYIKANPTGVSPAMHARVTADSSGKAFTSNDFINQSLPAAETMAQQGEAPEYYHNNVENGQRYGSRGYQDQDYPQDRPQYGINQQYDHRDVGNRQRGHQQHGYSEPDHHEGGPRQDSHHHYGYLDRDRRHNEYGGQNSYRENYPHENHQLEQAHRERELPSQPDAPEYYHNQPQRPVDNGIGVSWEELQQHAQAMNYDADNDDDDDAASASTISVVRDERRLRPADPLETDNELDLTLPGNVNGYWNPALDSPADRPSVTEPNAANNNCSVVVIDDAAYYDELKDFYESDPRRPTAEDNYGYTAKWYRAMALRRLEGGPPIAPVGGYVPTPETVRIKKGQAGGEKKVPKVDQERGVLRKASSRRG